ncbi:phosphatase PAP2 family protein [Marmoricola sp. OAE513]|uniref:phosphatase PAP2 family protein n=1 Tax=Marmoricola sp. OAE513 TaxID=2817894 RepID=UPI001AE85223
MTEASRRRLAWWIVGCTTVLVALTVLAVLGSDAMDKIDHAIGREPQDLTEDNRSTLTVWKWIGEATAPPWIVLYGAAGAGWLMSRHLYRPAAWAMVTLVVTDPLTRGLKDVVERQRPHWREPVEILHSYSFPSSHATSAAAAAGVAIVMAVTLVREVRRRRLIIAAALALALLVGADRIFLGVHNFSDIIAGYLFGAVVVMSGLLALGDPDGAGDADPATGPAR